MISTSSSLAAACVGKWSICTGSSCSTPSVVAYLCRPLTVSRLSLVLNGNIGVVSARSSGRIGGGRIFRSSDGVGIGGIFSVLGFLAPLFEVEGRRPLVEIEGRRSLLSPDVDFDRRLELPLEVLLLKGDGPGYCFDDLALLAGEAALLLPCLSLLGFCLSSFFVSFEFMTGNGGKAQSKLTKSGEGGPCCTIIVGLRVGARHGDLCPDVALTGEPIEPLPLLAGVSSPAKGTGTVNNGQLNSSQVSTRDSPATEESIFGRVGRCGFRKEGSRGGDVVEEMAMEGTGTG